jgi:hypothetical protein
MEWQRYDDEERKEQLSLTSIIRQFLSETNLLGDELPARK